VPGGENSLFLRFFLRPAEYALDKAGQGSTIMSKLSAKGNKFCRTGEDEYLDEEGIRGGLLAGRIGF